MEHRKRWPYFRHYWFMERNYPQAYSVEYWLFSQNQSYHLHNWPFIIQSLWILELAIALALVVSNLGFKKRPSHLITFESGGNRSQIDYILCRKQNFKLIIDVKIITGEECVTQHKLLVSDLWLKTCKPHPKPFFPKRRIWKLKKQTILRKYQDILTRTLNPNIDSDNVR